MGAQIFEEIAATNGGRVLIRPVDQSERIHNRIWSKIINLTPQTLLRIFLPIWHKVTSHLCSITQCIVKSPLIRNLRSDRCGNIGLADCIKATIFVPKILLRLCTRAASIFPLGLCRQVKRRHASPAAQPPHNAARNNNPI